jgi:predicted amidophosphoribosyltransferase
MSQEDKKLSEKYWDETILASCPECGAKLKKAGKCKKCGAEITGKAKFCYECGAKV